MDRGGYEDMRLVGTTDENGIERGFAYVATIVIVLVFATSLLCVLLYSILNNGLVETGNAIVLLLVGSPIWVPLLMWFVSFVGRLCR